MHDEFISIRIAKLRHPTDWCLGLFHVKSDAAFFELGDCGVDILNLESDRCSLAGRFPSWMTTDSDCHRAQIIFNPGAFHRRVGRLQLECFLIKFPSALRVAYSDGDECDFVCNHLQTPFSLSGFTLSRSSKLPIGKSQTKFSRQNPKKAITGSL